MTTAQLYALYLRWYDACDRLSGSGLALAALSPIERAIAQFAEWDAQNGILPRTRSDFERCVAQGADALVPLGLRAA